MAKAKKISRDGESRILKRPGHVAPLSEEIDLTAIRTGLLRWFRKSARDYPWRQTHNWFHLIMAELMLRRTRSDQVQAVYETFTKRYKNPARAHGDPDGVLDTIASLGLHWRNQQILDSIAFMSHTYGASTPKEQSDLTEIPGVGDYCNAMIRSRLYGDRLAAIDSNVARIYCRITGVPFHPEMRRKAWLKSMAQRLVQSGRNDPFETNLAFLDLAALVCKPGRPDCANCPIRKHCVTGSGQAG